MGIRRNFETNVTSVLISYSLHVAPSIGIFMHNLLESLDLSLPKA